MNFRLAASVLALATLAACSPSAPSVNAATAEAPPAADIATPPAGTAAPASTNASSTAPAVGAVAPAPASQPPEQTTAPPPATSAASPAATPEEIASGRSAYARTCAMCHGPTGQGTQMGVAITLKDPAAIAVKIAKGGEKMPPMAAMLSADEIDDVSKFVAAGLPD